MKSSLCQVPTEHRSLRLHQAADLYTTLKHPPEKVQVLKTTEKTHSASLQCLLYFAAQKFQKSFSHLPLVASCHADVCFYWSETCVSSLILELNGILFVALTAVHPSILYIMQVIFSIFKVVSVENSEVYIQRKKYKSSHHKNNFSTCLLHCCVSGVFFLWHQSHPAVCKVMHKAA